MQDPSEQKTRNVVASRGRAIGRWAIRLLGLLLVILAVFGVFLASPPGKVLVLRSVTAFVRTRLGVEARVAGFHYRLLAGGVTFQGVSAAQPGATRPFLTAERVDVDFSPAIILGRLALRRLDVSRPEIVLNASTRHAPAATRPGATSAGALPSFIIQRVDVRDLGLTISGAAGTQATLRGLSLALAGEGPGGLRGEAVASGGMSMQRSGSNIRLDRGRADMTLAGTVLSLASITINSPVATVGATARVDISRGDLDVKYDAHVNLGQLHQWWTDSPPVSGTLTATGTISGSVDEPVATIVARGEHLRWRDVPDLTVSASGRLSGGDLTIDRYDVSSSTADAHVGGRARLAVTGGGRASSLRVDARAGDSRHLALLTRSVAFPAVSFTLVADLSWPGLVPSGATLGGSVQATALDAGSPGSPLATLEANGQGGRWIVQQRAALEGDTRMAAQVSVVVDPATLSRSSIDGRIAAQSANVAAALQDLRRRGLSWANVEEVLEAGRATTDATLTGTLGAPQIQVSVKADSLTLAGMEQVRAEAQVRVDGRSVAISRMSVADSSNRVDLHGTATVGEGPVDLDVDGRLERPAALAPWLPAHWRPTGSLSISGKLNGSTRLPHFAARIAGSGFEANGIVIDTLNGGVTFERGVLHVIDLRLTHNDGWLRLDGDIFRNPAHLSIRGKGEKLALHVNHLKDPGVFPATASSPQALRLDDLSVEFDITGTPRQPTGTLSTSVGNLSFEGRELGPLTLSADGFDGAVRFDLALQNHRADITGTIGFQDGWPFDAHAQLRMSEVSPLLALLGATPAFPDTSGTVTASADIAGRLDRPFDSSVVLALSELECQLRGKPLKLEQPGRIRFDGGRLFVEEPFRLTLGGFSIGLASRADVRDTRGVVTTFDGRIEDGLAFLPPNVSITPYLLEGPVRAQVSLDYAGDRVAISGDADATLDRLIRAGHELASNMRVRARIRSGAIEISEAAGTVLGGPFIGAASVPISWIVPSWVASRTAAVADTPAEATLSARADVTLTRALQAVAIKRADLTGSAKLAIEARATAPRLESVEATLAMEAGELAINNVRVTQQRPTRLRFDNGRLEIDDLAWKAPRSGLTASGAIGLLPGTEGELRAEGTAALSLLGTIAPGATGEAAFQVRLSGPSGSRQVSANVDLQDVSLIAPKQQLALAGLSGALTLDGDMLEARGLRGQLNGGELTIDGAIPVRAGVAAPRPLRVEGRGLFVEIPKGLRSQLDTSLTWESAATGPRLSGQVTIASDAYREPITALAALAGSLTNASPTRSRTLPRWVTATTLDIRLKSVGPIVVDQSVLRIELVPDLQLTGTLGRPSLGGQVAIEDGGRIQAGGRTYRLTDSRLEFSPRAGLLPRLNVIGETRVSSYLVTLRIGGPANEIETNFSSDPPLSERDVRSLLITGQTADPARGSTESDRFAIGAVSGDVLGIAGQFVGLDSVRVGTEDLDLVASDVNPATRLTVSKRLGAKFELVVSENLEESQSTWIVIYRPIGGYEFRLSSEENTAQSFEFRQEITFGPGVSSRARVKTVAVVPDKVRSVTLAGEPGFAAAEVLAGTKIRAGHRFDFKEWLNDRDRIARFYRDRQHFSARVVPLRTSGEATTGSERPVDLQYRITRGPRTLLEVTGYPADDQFMERIRQTWSDNVLPALLGDSLAKAARDHLIDAGFLRARVEVEVDRPLPDAVRALINIEPGPRTDSRRLAFSGNRVIASEELQNLATSRGLEADAWKDSTRLIDEIRAAYAAKGHLAARAIADPVEFSNGAAVLWIRIEEGPLAHVASLTLTGVAAERRSDALRAIALPVGSPFSSGAGRAARSRLERHYRDLGYRDVRVEGTARADQGDGVVLAFTVSEGPLHVIRSVEIAGVQSTRASIVRQAVGLAAGEPAGAAAAAESERRLYELGTFRRAELSFEPEPAPTTVPGTVPVIAKVSVEEARRFQFRYGVELSSEYNSTLSQRANALGFAGDVRDRNFLGRGMSLGGGLRYESDLRSARSLFTVPRLAGHAIRTNVYLTARGEEDTSDQQVKVRDDEIELSIEQRWRVGRAIEYSWGYSANWRDTQLTSTARREPLAFAGTLASLNGAVVVDRRDSFFDAKRGWFSSVSLQWGERAFGSELDYLRTLVRGSYYQPFGPLVLAGNVRWGRLLPLGGVPPLTVFDLFFNAGGTESVRGYSQDELTAYDFLGAPLGGTKLLVLNGELRSPLFWRLGGVVFVDAGNTFAESQAIRFGDLAIGLGVGLRIVTPLAPIRIDVGWPRSLDKSGYRWHFSIGQMF